VGVLHGNMCADGRANGMVDAFPLIDGWVVLASARRAGQGSESTPRLRLSPRRRGGA